VLRFGYALRSHAVVARCRFWIACGCTATYVAHRLPVRLRLPHTLPHVYVPRTFYSGSVGSRLPLPVYVPLRTFTFGWLFGLRGLRFRLFALRSCTHTFTVRTPGSLTRFALRFPPLPRYYTLRHLPHHVTHLLLHVDVQHGCYNFTGWLRTVGVTAHGHISRTVLFYAHVTFAHILPVLPTAVTAVVTFAHIDFGYAYVTVYTHVVTITTFTVLLRLLLRLPVDGWLVGCWLRLLFVTFTLCRTFVVYLPHYPVYHVRSRGFGWLRFNVWLHHVTWLVT